MVERLIPAFRSNDETALGAPISGALAICAETR